MAHYQHSWIETVLLRGNTTRCGKTPQDGDDTKLSKKVSVFNTFCMTYDEQRNYYNLNGVVSGHFGHSNYQSS
jgi:hypothetical protein